MRIKTSVETSPERKWREEKIVAYNDREKCFFMKQKLQRILPVEIISNGSKVEEGKKKS